MLESLIPLAPHHCICYAPQGATMCVCLDAERTLRAYAEGHPMPPLTTAQREECLQEIACVEGYARADYEGVSDADLAQGVLHAWLDFCRDKGLL